MAETRRFELPDGRTLAWCEFGDPRGRPIFYAHGGPGSRLEGEFFDATAAQLGIRLIASDRPGMGQSTFLPGRTLLDYPRDISALADSLGIAAFGVMGWSGGGAHTTVCAYAIPDRLKAVVPLCGYTNFAELPGAGEMLRTKADRFAFRVSLKYPRLFETFFKGMKSTFRFFPGQARKGMLSALPGTDRAIIEDPDFWELMLADQREALNQGSKGIAVDARVHYVDWGFRLSEIPVQVHVFHGNDDHMVPFAFGEHLAANIPNAELHVMEGEGHLFPVTNQKLIFELIRAEFDAS